MDPQWMLAGFLAIIVVFFVIPRYITYREEMEVLKALGRGLESGRITKEDLRRIAEELDR